LLGLGLSAIALKADLIIRLIGRDDSRALSEIAEMTRICVTARTDIRLVTGEAAYLPLSAELAAARELLASAGIDVRADITDIADTPLSAEADAVLVPVLREAVTNILRHSDARNASIETVAGAGVLRMRVSNDGVAGPLAASDGTGHGLANLTARVEAAGGRLTSERTAGRFDLVAEIPLSVTGAAAVLQPSGRRGDPHRVHPVAPAEFGDRRC
jgi:two-component system sensor histidine kinase DesK